MKLIIFLSICIFTFQACHNSHPKIEKEILLKVKNVNDSGPPYFYKYNGLVLNKKVIDTILQLPFVKRDNHHVDSASGHQGEMDFILDTFRNKITAIAYRKEDYYDLLYRFTIDPASFEIKIFDIGSSEYITVAEYQKLNPDQK